MQAMPGGGKIYISIAENTGGTVSIFFEDEGGCPIKTAKTIKWTIADITTVHLSFGSYGLVLKTE